MTNPTYLFKPIKNLVGQFERLIKGRLWLKVLIALALGVMSGVSLGPDLGLVSTPVVRTVTACLALPGPVFPAIIQMIVVPLVVASIVRGLAANNNPAAMKKNGAITLIFIIISTALAAVIGILLALNIQPGNYIDASSLSDVSASPLTSTIANGFPGISELPGKVSVLIPINPLVSMASEEMLQVILFAAVLGAALLPIPRKTIQAVIRSVRDAAGCKLANCVMGNAAGASCSFWPYHQTGRKPWY